MRAIGLQDFGPYKIVRQIAVGGMAEIYLARQRGLEGVERTVVIKRILEDRAQDAEFVTMFLDEARLMAALSHPNIAQVFDVGQVDESYFLVMEHVRGPTLGRLLAEAKRGGSGLPAREALGIGLGIAEALHYVHERRDQLGRPLGIVHRDLNPSNVMVSYDGAVKLIDFGIAKATTKVYETRTGVVKGTYGYIAPEQLARGAPVDRRADVFALGILLYEMCVGAHPYDVSDEPDLVERVLEARYRRPRQVRPDFPPDLDRVIASCLAPRPDDRPEDMAALIEALAAHLGARAMVPTQTALAAATRALLPDEEGPRPIEGPASPGGIARQLGDRGPGPTTDEATKPTRAPARRDDTWTQPTMRLEERSELDPARPLDVPPDEALPREPGDEDDESPTARMSAPPPSPARASVDSPDEALPREPGDEDDESPTARMSAPPPSPARASVDPAPPEPLAPRTSAPSIPPAGPAWWTLAAVALVGLLAAGAATFAGMQVFGSAAPSEAALPAALPAPAVPAPPQAVTLRVVSEPPGASVRVDGALVEGATPLAITLPSREGHVWLRLSRAGFVDQEREVSAAVGEARFILSRLAIDAGDTEHRRARRRRRR